MSLPTRGGLKRAAARGIDAAISVVARLRRNRSGAVAIPQSPRVLVIRCDHIGDAVMATSVLGPLREALGPATLDVLAGPWAAPVFESHPAVDHVLTYAVPWWSAVRGASFGERARQWRELPRLVRQIKARRYDIGIDLRGDLRQIVLFLHFGGMPVRVSSDRTGGADLLTHVWPHDARLHEVEQDFAIASLVGARGNPRLSLHAGEANVGAIPLPPPGSYAVLTLRGSEENRQWPAESAANVADALHREHALSTVIVGGDSDVAIAEELERLASVPVLRLAGRVDLADSIAAMRGARVVVAVDSGPMHLAAATGVPLVALFGPGDPAECRPWSERAEVVASKAPCGCAGARCDFTRGPGRCMREISPAMVLEAVRRVLS